MQDAEGVTDTLDWIQSRGYYDDQIRDYRVVEGTEATTEELDLCAELDIALSQQGIEMPFKHQAQAVRAVRDGHNVVVATPTASGKTLTYTIPMFEGAIADSANREAPEVNSLSILL
jgi:DEAD/DEAH box helicase domain-containing protein